jgi:thiol-disulfide isomerase/thioredoxin
MLLRSFTLASLLLALGFLATPASADDPPPSPKRWINSPPLDLARLKGKLVVLYYFEEQCPQCRREWPERLAVSQQFADQPVLFVAVNSGNNEAGLMKYARQNGVNWPMIVDSDRSFEAATLRSPISLQNIMQVKLITPEGNFVSASYENLGATVAKYVSQAKWSVDPAGIPASLKGAWRAVELGEFGKAADSLAATKPKNADDKTAHDKLMAAVTAVFDERMREAKTAEDAGEKWKAFKLYRDINGQFKSLPQSKDVKEAGTRLVADPAVIREKKAGTMLAAAMKTAGGTTNAAKKRAMTMLDQVVKDFGDTEAGIEANQLLNPQTAAAAVPVGPATQQ